MLGFRSLWKFVVGFLMLGASSSVAVELAVAADPDEAGFTSIFDAPSLDGSSLDGWQAEPAATSGDWSVRENAEGERVITGIGSENRLSYLVWKDRALADFELTFRYRLRTEGNTGVEIRAHGDTSGKRPFEGYHADLGHVGIGPHILGAWDFHFASRHEPGCPRGTSLTIDAGGEVRKTEIADALTAADVHKRQWNDAHIIARGSRCQLFINGKLASEFVDEQGAESFARGAIGLQLHDKGMHVEFKDVRLKRLDAKKSAAAPTRSTNNKQRPNVVLIISDDHAWTDYSFVGHEHARTPNIDRLASEGLTFTRGYVTTAICSPSLATMLTGLYPHQHGITGNDPVRGQPREAWLDRFFERPLLPKLLADSGYLTLHTGKLWMRSPERTGFTDHMGPTGRHGGEALVIGRETMQPIHDAIAKSQREQKPFFIWYAPFLPHRPHNPPPRLLEKYAAVKDPAKQKYLAMVEWLDETTGRLMNQLKAAGVDDNTMIVYLADNGWNENGKAFPYENGVRTPYIIRWPGRVKPRVDRESLATNLDVMPTILSACGVKVPQGLPGVNLLDKPAVARRDTLFLANFAHDMVSPTEPEKSLWTRSCIEGQFKLIVWQDPPPPVKPYNNGDRRKNPETTVELFDLLSDPHETKNLAAKHPDIVANMRRRIDRWWDAGAGE